MKDVWPLIGRENEMRALMTQLRTEGGGVILVGPSGCGKTHLSTHFLDKARQEGFATVRVSATRSASELPLGCFAPLLPDLDRSVDRGHTLRRVARSIVERGKGRPVVLMVDDAHYLDPLSAVLTHQLAASGAAFVVVTEQLGEVPQDPIVALWKDGIVSRIEVKPLARDQIRQLLAEVLGKPVSRATERVFYERSAGNVLFLRELLLAAFECSAMQDSGAMWHLTAELEPSSRMIELFNARLSGFSQQIRDALELLALGEPMASNLFTELVGDQVLDDLERRRLAQVIRENDRIDVRLAQPLYGDILLASVSRLRRRSLYRRLSDALKGRVGPQDPEILRFVTWRLRSGQKVDPDQCLSAAHRSWALHDAPLTEELVRAALDAGAGLDGELLLAYVLSVTDRAEEAELALASPASKPIDDAERAALACARMGNLSYSLGRLDEALLVGQAAAGAITDTACKHEILAHVGSLLSLGGRTAEAVQVLSPLLERSNGPSFVWACRTVAYAAAQNGQTSTALEFAGRGRIEHRRVQDGIPFHESVHTSNRVTALSSYGSLADAEALARETYEAGLIERSIETQTSMTTPLSVISVLQGRIATAIRWGREAAALTRAGGRVMMRWGALARLAEALALGGEVNEAARVLDELDSLEVPMVHFMEADVLRSRAWLEVARGAIPAAREFLEEACTVGVKTDNLVAACAAHHDLVRLGYPEHAAACGELADRIEGPLAQLRSRHARAVAARDAAQLATVSADFEGIGAMLLAAEAAAEAATNFERTNDKRAAAAARLRAGKLASLCEGGQTPALAVTSHSCSLLTARQFEIASLAASGLSNKEIAGKLCLSVRTVENKLHAAYNLLGVSGRSELPTAIKGLAEHPGDALAERGPMPTAVDPRR